MFTEVFNEVLSHEGVVSIVSWANSNAHVVNSWNSYLITKDNNKLLVPASGMRETQAHVDINPNVKLTFGSKEVEGTMGMGIGFLVEGTATFLESGEEFDIIKEKFSWANRVLIVTVTSVQQTV